MSILAISWFLYPGMLLAMEEYPNNWLFHNIWSSIYDLWNYETVAHPIEPVQPDCPPELLKVRRDPTLAKLRYEDQQFQFLDHDDAPLIHEGNPSPKYSKSDLMHKLMMTKQVYDDAIQRIQDVSYKEIISLHVDKKYIRKSTIENMLNIYLANNELQECSVSHEDIKKEHYFQKIEKYMKLCKAVYTDFNTRDFIANQGSLFFKRKYEELVSHKDEIGRLLNLVSELNKKYSELTQQPGIFVNSGTKYKPNEQKISIQRHGQVQRIKEDYKATILEVNQFLKLLSPQPTNDEWLQIISKEKLYEYVENLDFQSVISKLNNIRVMINNDYSWHFEENRKDLAELIKDVGGKSAADDKKLAIPKYVDTKNREHQLKAKAVVASSFLSKSGLSMDENITILDVGFRNQQSYGSLWNTFITNRFWFKKNDQAWFQKNGEVDYIAYLEKDPTEEKKDKIVIVYSGSNSQMDWGINFTFGHNQFLGLSVHEGIGWLFETSINTYHHMLHERIKEYYRTHRKPKQVEIITTGHSLGGALAGLAAYYYKTHEPIINEIIDPKTKVSIKTFSFGAPAIVHQNSQKYYSDMLGAENIFRIWNEDDPVVNWTGEKSFFQSFIQGSNHVGQSICLNNERKLPHKMLDWWGPHGANRYLSHLRAKVVDLGECEITADYDLWCRTLKDIVNNYIKTSHLDVYKKGLGKLSSLIEELKNLDYKKEDLDIPLDLAKHIVKYSPITFKNVQPKNIGDIPLHSPRHSGYHPHIKVKLKEKLQAKFMILGIPVEYPINRRSNCSIDSMQSFLNEKYNIILPKNSVEQYSCGCYFAKHIFLSRQLSLSDIFLKCVEDQACTSAYLQETSNGKNTLEHIQYILTAIGLDEKFKDMELCSANAEKNFSDLSNDDQFDSADKLLYQRFLNGRLIYRPNKNSDEGKIEFPIAELANPLAGEFDLSKTGWLADKLSIHTGYRKAKISPNYDAKLQMWIAPRFLVKKNIKGSAKHLDQMFVEEWPDTADIGLIWTWGEWGDLTWYDFHTTQGFDNISDDNFYEKWKKRKEAKVEEQLTRTVGGVHTRYSNTLTRRSCAYYQTDLSSDCEIEYDNPIWLSAKKFDDCHVSCTASCALPHFQIVF